jgi:hypothetical protein
MARHFNGETVKAGFYFNLASWEVQALSGDGGVLGGKVGEPWVRMPAILLLVLAPIMGAAYVVFLPFIGIAMFLNHLFGRVAASMRRPEVRPAGTATIDRQPPAPPRARRKEAGRNEHRH